MSLVISEKFESLSDEALFALAEKMGLDVPPSLDRVFVIEEIVGALEEDSLERRSSGGAPIHIEEKKFSGSELDGIEACIEAAPCIERRYNETVVHALVRDPSWAFAFWDLADSDRAALRSQESQSALFLRIQEAGADGEGTREYFDIPVAEDDLQWYINLPRPNARYRIELRARAGGRSRLLARSALVVAPRQTLDEAAAAFDPRTAELLRLSGLDSLKIEPEALGNPQRILSGSESD